MDDDALGAWRALLNVHADVTARVEAELSGAGLPPLAWYDVLWPLYGAPDLRLRMGALASQATLSRTGLTRLVDRIEAAGLRPDARAEQLPVADFIRLANLRATA